MHIALGRERHLTTDDEADITTGSTDVHRDQVWFIEDGRQMCAANHASSRTRLQSVDCVSRSHRGIHDAPTALHDECGVMVVPLLEPGAECPKVCGDQGLNV